MVQKTEHKKLKGLTTQSFNPAEAEEWFRRDLTKNNMKNLGTKVSIQPKPKNGLEEETSITFAT